MDDIEQAMSRDGLWEEYHEHLDDIADLLRDRDTSTPLHDLLANTCKMSCFYSLGYDVDGWHEAFMVAPWRNTTTKQEAANIRCKLGIAKGTEDAKKVEALVEEASFGGDLRIYFNGNLEDMITNEAKDFKTIRFKGKFAVAVYNSREGSGWFEVFELDHEFPFIRENIAYSESERYSLESCFGACPDWLDSYDTPTFSMTGKTKRTIKKSDTAEIRSQEAEYKRVFKNGGCTLGDTDIRRHRNVTYTNAVPCGWKCPHCGQFWID
jgi:hypothetical protein